MMAYDEEYSSDIATFRSEEPLAHMFIDHTNH